MYEKRKNGILERKSQKPSFNFQENSNTTKKEIWTIMHPFACSMKPYDLQERTALFAKNVRTFLRLLPKGIANMEDSRQLVRSSGSIAANYIEANESLGQRDGLMHLRISRKEAKESMLWLSLLHTQENTELQTLQASLVKEARELVLIFSSILRKSGK